ncbi:MAG: FAD-dependent oxidoreductase, partial [Verrucomicrobiota bacterium]
MRLLAFLPLFLIATLCAQTHQADIVIYGGTSAGVIAGIQAAKLGKKVIIVEPGQHIGGMAVEGLGGTDIDNHKEIRNSPAVGGLAREFYRRISLKYNRNGAFDAIAANGTKNTGLWRFESHVAEAVYDAWVKEARVTVLRGHRLRETGGVTMEKQKIVSIACENGAVIKGKVFIDATYEGDLLAFAGLSFAVGREGNAKYHETTNGLQLDSKHKQLDKKIDPYVRPGDASSGLNYGVQPTPLGKDGDPDDGIQGYCFRLCLTRAADRTPIEKPSDYDPARYE